MISDLDLGESSVGQLKAGVTSASADSERVRLGALGELCMREGAADRPPTRPDVVKCSFQPTVPSLPDNCFKARGGRRSSLFGGAGEERVGAGEGSW